MPPLRLLLSGPPGCGKTTLCTRVKERLHERLQAVLPDARLDGILSREVRNSRGSKIGYELYSLDQALCETIASSEGPESGVVVSRYHVYVDAIARVALPVLDGALSASGIRIFVLDDIGNMTCKSDDFCNRVKSLLESPDPGLHVLAAVGMGAASLISESRRLCGVTTFAIDEGSRDSALDRLTSKLLAAALQDSDDDDAQSGSEAGDDLADFDQWGGDCRQLGVKRGMYCPHLAPGIQNRGQDPKREAPIERSTPSFAKAAVEHSSGKTTAESTASRGAADPVLSAARSTQKWNGWQSSDGLDESSLGIVEWLDKIDFFLVAAYGEAMRNRFGIVREVVDTYMHASSAVSEQFFTDFGVTKLGHKRLFEKWFRERGQACCSQQRA